MDSLGGPSRLPGFFLCVGEGGSELSMVEVVAPTEVVAPVEVVAPGAYPG